MNSITETTLPLMEAFYTLQGEGFHQGKAAYFIRLGGCDVGCHWCDVKESWDAKQHPAISIAEIVSQAEQYPARLAVITGGEPCMYDLEELCEALHKAGFQVNIETSGAYPLKGDIDWICFSPKKFKPALESFYQEAHELKVVVYHLSDLQWAENHATRMHPKALLYLQPEWSRAESITPAIIDYVKAHPQWRISLQTHKYLQIP